jgi:hypothetical protein
LGIYFQGKEEEEGFYWAVATIYEVSHEEVIGIWAFSTYLEELHKVVELTVDISTNLEESLISKFLVGKIVLHS